MTSTLTAITGPRFADFFDAPLPRGLRDLAADMSWDDVAATFGSSAGPIRLMQWEPAARDGRHAHTYTATIAVGDRSATTTATAAGPLGALTAMLHERGIAVEMLNFHQLRAGGQTATFIRGTDGIDTEWAIAWSECAHQSALRAVIACANRLAC
ncbi:homocitrate synthase [Mycolicibacterium bacteremicum]|uniref:homocitrate synthase n=1 Tax=Mycolicibacterium bacteremicum TaxID=564198 RepID=UPI0026EDA146|nr:homocitrate synthase [Mycolicibacterium bacteremicum]